MMAAQKLSEHPQLRYDEPMAAHTSWRVGGTADCYFEPRNISDLQEFLSDLPADIPILWIGYGSNLLVRDDEEFKGLRLADIQTATVDEVMCPIVHCIRQDRPIAVAASTMIDKRIHRLIVVDEHFHVLGLISALDALRAVPGVEKLIPA